MKLAELLDKELARKEYKAKTVEAYKYWARQLTEFFPDIPAKEISEGQIREYLSFLMNRKRLATASIRQAKHSLHWVYNDFWRMNYDIKSFPIPKRIRQPPDILYPSEMLTLLSSLSDERMHLIFAVIYSAGLEASEVANLRVSDINFNHKRINVRRVYAKGIRSAVLSDHVSDELKKYIDVHKPTRWLFEGRAEGTHISTDVIQRAFRRALRDSHIDKNATVRTLRYSYVKHLEWQGVPLRNILIHLDMLNSYNLRFYSEIEPSDATVNHSPLDRIVLSTGEGRVDTSSLGRMLTVVKNDDEKDYILESIRCIDCGAYRAGVVFAWIAAIQNIRRRCINHSLPSVNSFIKSHAPKAIDVKSIDDFAYIKDSIVLQVGEDLGEFDKNERAALVECLNMRNRCGHPGKYSPQPHRVNAFIEELITMIFSKT